MHKKRTPLSLGWEAARANAAPALVIQAFILVLLVTYYTDRRVASALTQLAEFKRSHGLLFVIVASITVGALIPELFLILFFQRGRPTPKKPSQFAFYDSGLGLRRNSGRSFVSKRGSLVWRRCCIACGGRKSLR